MAKQQSIFAVFSKFNTEEKCIKHLERIRWPKGLRCPHCDGKRIMTFTAEGKTGKERSLYECIECRYQYSVTVGMVFHDSHLPLVKWFLAIYMICSARMAWPRRSCSGSWKSVPIRLPGTWPIVFDSL